MAKANKKQGPVKTIDTTLEIINVVKEHDGIRPGEVADELDLPKSTVSDHVVTLRRNQYLKKRGNEYHVGLKFLELGDRARNRHQTYEVSQKKINKLAKQTGELVHLSVEENGRGVIIYEREGSEAVSLDTYVGRRVHLHCTGLGKAMLAHMPHERVETILDEHGTPRITSETITDRDELLEQLEAVRERGYAVSRGERIPELGSIAAPIVDSRKNRVHGAISVCIPTTRMEQSRRTEEIPTEVRQIANRIELDIKYE